MSIAVTVLSFPTNDVSDDCVHTLVASGLIIFSWSLIKSRNIANMDVDS